MSGVPRGNHLDLLLLHLLTYDLSSCLQSPKVLMFADVVQFILSLNSLKDAKCLRADLTELYVWCNRNNMSFNLKNCKQLTLCRVFRLLLAASLIPISCTMFRTALILGPYWILIPRCKPSESFLLGFIKHWSYEFNSFISKRLFIGPLSENSLVIRSPSDRHCVD